MPQKFQTLKKSKKLTKSSQKWLLRQINDPFVELAKKEGWKSRAAFKIIEIDDKFKIFKKGNLILDLGAAPGGWSQVAVDRVGFGNVLALDLLEIDPIAGVKFFQQDFLAPNAHEEIIAKFEELKSETKQKFKGFDVVMTDMAANTTGDKTTDHLRIITLLEESLILAEKILNAGGSFVGKVFQGGSSDEILRQLRKSFSSVKYFKPDSSRKDSSEIYLVALNFKKS